MQPNKIIKQFYMYESMTITDPCVWLVIFLTTGSFHHLGTVDASVRGFLWPYEKAVQWLTREVSLSLHTTIILSSWREEGTEEKREESNKKGREGEGMEKEWRESDIESEGEVGGKEENEGEEEEEEEEEEGEEEEEYTQMCEGIHRKARGCKPHAPKLLSCTLASLMGGAGRFPGNYISAGSPVPQATGATM